MKMFGFGKGGEVKEYVVSGKSGRLKIPVFAEDEERAREEAAKILQDMWGISEDTAKTVIKEFKVEEVKRE